MVRCLATLALRQPCRVQAQNSCGLGSSPLHTVGVSLRFEPVGHQSGKKLLQQFVAETNYERKFFFVGALMEKMLLKIPLPSNTFRHQKFFEVRVWFCALGVFFHHGVDTERLQNFGQQVVSISDWCVRTLPLRVSLLRARLGWFSVALWHFWLQVYTMVCGL